MVSGYVPVAIFAVLIVGFGVVSLAAAQLLRPSRPEIVKLMNYECGAEPIGPAWIQFPVGFYLVALIFIVFDALAVFLLPWLLVLRPLGLPAFWTRKLAYFIPRNPGPTIRPPPTEMNAGRSMFFMASASWALR